MADSLRWDGFELRNGDIIISTPPKCGTTWTQMLCALLIFDGPDFPGPIDRMSPWLDMQTRSIDEVRAIYAQQQHRRFIKTHTPLDGVPQRDDVTYIVVGRDPRDVLVSMEHHRANMRIDRVLEMRAAAVGADDLAEFGPPVPPSDDPAERFRLFVESDAPVPELTVSNVLHHLDTAWQRRSERNITLRHYADYRADLAGELRRMATALGIELSASRAADLAAEASLERMRERADEVVPSASTGQWRSTEAFLRAGSTGEWRNRVTDDDVAAYEARVASLVSPDLAAWVHLGRLGSGIDPSVD